MEQCHIKSKNLIIQIIVNRNVGPNPRNTSIRYLIISLTATD